MWRYWPISTSHSIRDLRGGVLRLTLLAQATFRRGRIRSGLSQATVSAFVRVPRCLLCLVIRSPVSSPAPDQ